MRHARLFLLSAALPLLLSACASSSLPGFMQPYQYDINQGNILEDDKLAKLRLGMSKEQVRFQLGSPMLEDIFHAERWDYVYYQKKGKAAPVQRNFSLFFEDGRLARSEPPLESLPTLPEKTM